MSKSKFYDGTKLLSLTDKNGKKPEIFICTSNRSAGKTTYFSRLLVNRFIKKGEKFMLIYRFRNELDGVSEKFFKEINYLFFDNYTMSEKSMSHGLYVELFLQKDQLENKSCGYAIALNSADSLKKLSHAFSDVSSMLFDEFQSETDHYCSKEVEKLISVHTTVARGGGKMVRYVPVYMVSNPVSMLNPYYISLRVCDRLDDKTRFLRGEGYVLEQGYNDAAATAQKQSAFNQAFGDNRYLAYSAQSVYLNDNTAFIEKLSGKSEYFCTLKVDGLHYAVRLFDKLCYCDDRPDMTFGTVITTNRNDLSVGSIMLSHSSFEVYMLKRYFEAGLFRFKNAKCKQAVLETIYNYS